LLRAHPHRYSQLTARHHASGETCPPSHSPLFTCQSSAIRRQKRRPLGRRGYLHCFDKMSSRPGPSVSLACERSAPRGGTVAARPSSRHTRASIVPALSDVKGDDSTESISLCHRPSGGSRRSRHESKYSSYSLRCQGDCFVSNQPSLHRYRDDSQPDTSRSIVLAVRLVKDAE
jgi:hypothetical protein